MPMQLMDSFSYLLLLSGVLNGICNKHNPNYSKDLEASESEASIIFVTMKSDLWPDVGRGDKGSALSVKNYSANSLVGIRRDGELNILRGAKLQFCEAWCNQRKKRRRTSD